MGAETGIQWTDATWNPVRGCSRVSPGCERCYAEVMAARFSGPGRPFRTFAADGRWTGKVALAPEMLDAPLRWQRPRRIFVNSMSDIFHERLPDEAIDQVFAAMLLAPRHTFQVLTKRAERMANYFRAPDLYQRVLAAADKIRADRPGLTAVGISDPAKFPAPWIWLGVSVEDQRRADERIPHLLATPAATRFLSSEPLLGEVDLRIALAGNVTWDSTGREVRRSMIDWVIVGGESGPGARPMRIEWARSIVDQCRAAQVACFFKQTGSVFAREHHLLDAKGGDVSELSADIQVRQFPEARR